MNAQEIRDKFTDFFVQKGHEKIASSSLIPHNDDTLLFANAGMNQFKDFFTGKATPKNKRAVTIQKCVRAGGKHNDLENVGFTARHHTFFEMLGNFSFGDYFKKEAIDFAWEFLTEVVKLPKEKLIVTVHTTDDEAWNIWTKDIGIPENKIFRKGDKDNFWEMGEFGPCGPCSEIFYDHGEVNSTHGYKPTSDEPFDDGGRFVEIWNLVFMQFEKTPEGQFPLPNPSIDTGMGLERLIAALSSTYYNYDTDVFEAIIKETEKLTGKKYCDENATSFRVVADHIRSCTMLITDGVIPSNEGRGYVLRRIIRRAVRHLKELGAPANSFHKLVPVVIHLLGQEYPQNKANESLAVKFLQVEEKKFLETLDQGLKFLNDSLKTNVKDGVFSGEAAFKLYDTYGFPLDLTEVILKEKDIGVDTNGFDKAMEARKADSRKSWKGGQIINADVFHDVKNKYGATSFLGYEKQTIKAKLLKIVDNDDSKALVFDKTPFYGESGGQMGDSGQIIDGNDVVAHIFDTQKPVDDLFVHFSKDADALEEGREYTLAINSARRATTARNHSATHLLQSALIKVLGDHVKQAGSMVSHDRLRFDFTHMQALSKQEIKQVELLVNEQITEALEVKASISSMDDAIKKGAMALFGEKYGDQVRVLEMGNFSTELCGGTHVHNTSDIGLFVITSEASLSTGVRRIEGTTSSNALGLLLNRSEVLRELELKTSAKESKVLEKVDGLYNDIKNKQKEINMLKDKLNSMESSDLFSNPEKISGYDFKFAKAPEGSDLKKLSDNFIDKYPNGILVMYAIKDGKTSALIRASKSVKSLNCNELLKESLSEINGRGGGRPDMAQGSGDSAGIEKFEKKVRELINEKLA